jgi:hypothetical protein
MADQTVRCPGCMLSDQRKPMLQRLDCYVCEQCRYFLHAY